MKTTFRRVVGGRYAGGAVWLLVLLVLLFVANLVSLSLISPSHRITMGDGFDKLFLDHMHNTEVDTQETAYRWTRGDSRLVVRGFAAVSPAFLDIETGGLPAAIPAPRRLTLSVDGSRWTTLPVQRVPRRYALLLPHDALRDGNLDVRFQSETTKVAPDTRQLGVRIDRFDLGWFPTTLALPPRSMLLVQWLATVATLAIALRLGLPRWSMRLIAAGFVVGFAAMTGSNLLIATSWQTRILATALATLLLCWSAYPLTRRVLPHATAPELRWLWIIFLSALALRMVPMLYPPFDTHDWYIHRKRIHEFLWGSFLIYDKPAEFSKKLTIVPPAPYLFYAPFTLLASNVVAAMQWVYTFFDSITTLLVGLLMRSFRVGARPSLLAALVVALFPLNFTALWWGFGPQVIGQFFVVLVALLAAQPSLHSPLVRWAAGLAFAILLLSHIGAGILGGCMLTGAVVLVWLFQREQRFHWQFWGIVVIACGILVTLIFYSQVIGMQLQGLSSNQRIGWTEDDLFRVPWTIQSLWPSFKPLGVALPLVSIIMLLAAVRSTHRWLLASWVGSALFFFLVDLATGLQVRYAYFLVPVVAGGLAVLLHQLIRRHRLGWVITCCLIGLVALAGLSLWYEGTILWLKPSLRGLTH